MKGFDHLFCHFLDGNILSDTPKGERSRLYSDFEDFSVIGQGAFGCVVRVSALLSLLFSYERS